MRAVIVLWIVLVLVCATWLAAEWLRARCRHQVAASRHSAWATMVSDLPPGSRLTGVELDARTRLEIGSTVQGTLESRGGR
ncbi:MAG TPA: hypothetical protein VGX25_09735 [Actinophytocola sp.]|uniref:hypothetical protein n=1 Tax=Actinophytocola sp. TaxID=1872138 RepID=UPI002DDDA61E|nr:hypothetical protein [Actinophytocola sp.]HEV2779668.1 hypothetical protein [Actinophytocola sp.]